MAALPQEVDVAALPPSMRFDPTTFQLIVGLDSPDCRVVDVRALLHQHGAMHDLFKYDDTTLSVHAGRLACISVKDAHGVGYAVTRGAKKQPLQLCGTFEEACAARAAAVRARKRKGEKEPAAANAQSAMPAAAASGQPDMPPPPPSPAESEDVTYVGMQTLEERNARGFANAIEVD